MAASVVEAIERQQPLSTHELTLLQLCFDESEFGVAVATPTTKSTPTAGDNTNNKFDDANEDSQAEGWRAEDDEAFDAARFVSEKLQHVPLNTLEGDLKSYSNYLQSKIIHHIHDDVHEAFVEVSGELVGMRDSMTKVEQPLVATLQRVNNAVAALSQTKVSVDKKLAEAAAYEQERAFNANLLRVLLMHDRLCGIVERIEESTKTLGIESLESHESRLSPTKQNPGTPTNGGKTPQDIPASALKGTASGSASFAAAAATQHLSAADVAELQHRLQGDLHAAAAEIQQMDDAANELPELTASVAEAGFANNAPYAQERADAIQLAKESRAALMQDFAAVLLYAQNQLMVGPNNKSGPAPAAGTIEGATALLTSVLRCFHLLHEEAAVERLYREHVVRQAVEEVVTWKRASEARQKEGEAAALIEALCKQLSTRVLVVVPLLRDVLGISPLSTIVWPIVSEVIQKRVSFMFVPGIPKTFHTNFTVAHQLVELLEGACTDLDELLDLRNSPDMATVWRRKWNLEVYYTLRQAEMNEKIEAIKKMSIDAPKVGASKPRTPLTPSSPSAPKFNDFAYPHFEKLAEAMLWGFEPEVFLYPLGSQFTKGALVAAADVINHLVSATSAGKDDGANGDDDDASAMTALHLAADLKRFEQFMNASFIPTVEQATCESASGSSPLHGIAMLAVSLTTDGSAKALHGLEEGLVARCDSSLLHVRTVKSAYSMTKKPMPIAPSWYVAGVVEPLKKFKSATVASGVADPEVLDGLVRRAAEELTSRFRQYAKETILSAKKAQESLEKLRGRKKKAEEGADAGADGAEGGAKQRPTSETATDRDKMMVQLYLDISEFLELLRPLGIQADSMPAAERLTSLVLRAKWILGDDIPEPPEVEDDS